MNFQRLLYRDTKVIVQEWYEFLLKELSEFSDRRLLAARRDCLKTIKIKIMKKQLEVCDIALEDLVEILSHIEMLFQIFLVFRLVCSSSKSTEFSPIWKLPLLWPKCVWRMSDRNANSENNEMDSLTREDHRYFEKM